MELLGRAHVSGVPVTTGGKLVGVVTATDLMTFAAALSGVPTQREEGGAWLEGEVEQTVDDAEREDEAAGAFFSELWEDAGADIVERFGESFSPEWNVLEEHDVSEVMTHTPLVTVTPDSSAEAAAGLMQQYRVHRVLVTDGERLVGILTTTDIARAVADRRFHSRAYVFGHPRTSSR
jgi:CBS domain-containing protein